MSKYQIHKNGFRIKQEQSEFYTEIIEESYFGDKEEGGRFKGAIHKPFEYRKVKAEMSQEENRQFQQQRNLFDFMRRLLVKI